MNTNNNFLNECNHFLKPFGYSIHFHNPDYSSITYWCTNKITENYPSITCDFKEGEKSMIINDCSSYRLCGQLSTGKIGFKPGNISLYLETFKHFADLAMNNPPW